MKNFAVIGLGRFGYSLAKTLTEMGHQVMAIDISEERVQELQEHVTHAVQVDAIEEDALRALGIRNFDTVVVAIGQDIQASILATLILKELGIRYVVAKARTAWHGKVLEKIGADRVVYPEMEMGKRVAHNLVSNNVLDNIELSPQHSIVELVAPPSFIGKNLGQIDLRRRYRISVLAIKKQENVEVAPGGEYLIEPGDVLVVIGSRKDLDRFEEKV
ncbi:MAG: potassium channel family protein [Bacillota bacterium]